MNQLTLFPLGKDIFYHRDSISHDKAQGELDWCVVNTTLTAVEATKNPQYISSEHNFDSQFSIDQT